MNLYLIWQKVNTGYDTWDSMVVAAPHEFAARKIRPDGELRVGDSDMYWASTEYVHVKLIGRAVRGTKKGKILASFNAG